MQLPKDFKEFVELMIDANVRFVMIGGYAYNLYRNPRATGDIDFIVASDKGNQIRLRIALDKFGFGSVLPPANQLLIEDGKVLMLGRAPFRIDLLVEIDGVRFDDIERTAQTFVVDEIEIPVISPELLLKNKQSTGREKDLADALELEKWLISGGDDTTSQSP